MSDHHHDHHHHDAIEVKGLQYHAVYGDTPRTRDIFNRLANAPYFSVELHKELHETGDILLPVHHQFPMSYTNQSGGQTARYIWTRTDSIDPAQMMMIEADIVDGRADIDSHLMLHGSDFKGALVYQKSCCKAPSIVLVGYGEEPLIKDNPQDMMADSMRRFWVDRVFTAEEGDMHNMLHALQDALGQCSSHAHNARPHLHPK